MKELKIKRDFVHAIYNSLKTVPPSEFLTTEEIMTTSNDILPLLKENCIKHVEFFEGIDDLRKKIATKKITEEEGTKERDKNIEVFNKYTEEHKDDVISLKFEDAVFKVLKEQFERKDWGTKFLSTIEDFVIVTKAFKEAEEGHVKSDKE